MQLGQHRRRVIVEPGGLAEAPEDERQCPGVPMRGEGSAGPLGSWLTLPPEGSLYFRRPICALRSRVHLAQPVSDVSRARATAPGLARMGRPA
jgi:hypothetical protein